MTTVHAAPSYSIRPQTGPPPGYPTQPHPDIYQPVPSGATYDERRAAFISHILENPAPQNTKPVWYELARMAGGMAAHEGIIESALDFIDARKDCSDFVLHGIIRMLYQFGGQPGKPAEGISISTGSSQAISPALLARARRTTLNFKYFPNEPGIDSLCTWTENHYILFTSAAYLTGQLYPDEVFTNSGETGRQKVQVNRTRILRWLALRFHTGFSEWLSHVYYDEDLTALLALYDFAQDDEIRTKAAMVLDLLLLDIAINSFKGVFGSTHGRAYENTKKWASNEGTTDTSRLLFGTGVFSGFDNMSAVAFALSSYRIPLAIAQTAIEASHLPSFENRQRMGIRLAEMERWGLHPDNFEDGMLTLTLEAYLHPRTAANTLKMFDTCNWWENYFLSSFKPFRGFLRFMAAARLLPLLARLVERDVCRNTREEVNIYTYHTPDYMLSTAQDYRQGYGGDQQHIWQATLGPDAVCFTTHPAKIDGVSPNYWAGSGLLPRAAQVKNLVIAVYKIEAIPALYVPIRHFYTHAWLPKDQFDEIVEQKGWIFARKGEGYLALWSRNQYFWNSQDVIPGEITIRKNPEDLGREVIAPGKHNIWLCQMGRQVVDGPFARFIDTITRAEVVSNDLSIQYAAPSLGLVRFGWHEPLTVNGAPVTLHDYPRYENPFVQAPFNPEVVRVKAGENELTLHWEIIQRSLT